MRIIARTAAALLATTLVVGASATSAFAQTDTVKDKASDVVRYANDEDQTGTVLGYADSVASGADLRSLRAKHTKKSVAIRISFANLQAGTTVYAGIRVDGKSQPSRILVTATRTSGVVINARGEKRCSVPLTTRLGARGYVNAVIKRSCLGNPKRVKVTADAVAFASSEPSTPYDVDVLSPTNLRAETYTKWLKAS